MEGVARVDRCLFIGSTLVLLHRNWVPQSREPVLAFANGPDLKTRRHYYWRLEPSAKALRRELDKLQTVTATQKGSPPLPELIGQLNRHLKGWANYYRLGHPRMTFRKVNWYVRRRLYRLLRRRSQRPWKKPKERTVYQYFHQLGLIYL